MNHWAYVRAGVTLITLENAKKAIKVANPKSDSKITLDSGNEVTVTYVQHL